MRAAPPRLLVLLVVLVGIIEQIKPTKGLCLCAERFASASDFINDTSASTFDNFKNGQTIVFTNAAFHCNTILTTVSFSGQTKNCGDIHCTDSNSNNNINGLQPMLQLWRKANNTVYTIMESIELNAQQIDTDVMVDWFVEIDDVLGIWIPSSCHCSTTLLKIGYLYGHGGSRVYRIDGDPIDYFDPTEYVLLRGPLPMITVKTDENFNAVCIIGLPAGSLVALIALCFTCAGICWSISLYNNKRRKASRGTFDISVPLQDQDQEGIEMSHVPSQVASDDYSYTETMPTEQQFNSLGRPIYTMPLPPVPTNIDDANDTRSLTSERQQSYTSQTTHNSIHHSMSNPDLSTHSYGNIDHTADYRSLTRDHDMHQENQNLPRAPLARPRSINAHKDSVTGTVPPYPIVMPSNTIHDPDNSVIPPSSPGLNSTTESNRGQSYDRDSEYELPDDESSEAGEVENEYMNNLRIDSIDSSGSDDVYY